MKRIITKILVINIIIIHLAIPALFNNDLLAEQAASGLSAGEIVRLADEIRFPTEPFEIKAKMITKKPGQQDSLLYMNIYSKGTEKVLVHFLAPEMEKDKAVLMVENNMWMYMPNIKKSIKISPQQRLVATQFSNGDVVRISLSTDYDAQIIGVEKIDDREAYHLELTARDPKTSYNKIHYWVGKGNFLPIKEEFYSVSGRLLKTLYFMKFKEMAGKTRPYELKMTDALNKNNISVMIFIDIKIVELSDLFFTRSRLEMGKK